MYVKNISDDMVFLYEAIGVICYGKRLNCLSANLLECDAIVKANVQFLKALGETFHQPPWWKLWRTKSYKIIESTQDLMMTWGKYGFFSQSMRN